MPHHHGWQLGHPQTAAEGGVEVDPERVWHLPLNDVHPNAPLVADAAEAAADQGAFWEMRDLLLDHQAALRPDDLLGYAEQVSLDVDRFTIALHEHTGAGRVAEDLDSADLSGVSCTPTFFITADGSAAGRGGHVVLPTPSRPGGHGLGSGPRGACVSGPVPSGGVP